MAAGSCLDTHRTTRQAPQFLYKIIFSKAF